MTRGFNFKSPLTFPYNSNISLSFIGLCPGWQWLLLLCDVGSLGHFLPEEACLVTIEYLLGNKYFGPYIFLKFCHEIISSYFVWTAASHASLHYECQFFFFLFLKFIELPPTSLKGITFSTRSKGVFQVSMQHLRVFIHQCLWNAVAG